MQTATAIPSTRSLPPPIGWLVRILVGWPFAVFALTLFSTVTILSVSMVLVPVSDTGLGAFALAFKTWCFGYDAATGKFQVVYVITMVMQATMLSGLVAWLWWGPLRDGWAVAKRRMLVTVAATLVISIGSLALLAPMDDGVPTGELPFPAEEIRTAHTPPAFRLTDHRGRPVAIADFRGKVVIVTAVYASCGETCPTIMAQARRVVGDIAPELQQDVVLLAITLDPERDDVARLEQIAAAQELDDRVFHLVTGEPSAVNRALDLLQIARTKDPKTGRIDHANVFALVDRQGKLAYRLSIGAQQSRWMSTAVDLLLAE